MQNEAYECQIYMKNVKAHIFEEIIRNRPLRRKYTQNSVNNTNFMKREASKRLQKTPSVDTAACEDTVKIMKNTHFQES